MPTNPQAFPSHETFEEFDSATERYVTKIRSTGGATLRDYFAAKALQGLLANEAISRSVNADVKAGASDGKTDYAVMSYKLADAMLAQREGK